MLGERGWLFGGLFLTTLATLMLELLDSRLLSVLTWYHLAALAVSLAMLGMSAGAVFVFLGGARFQGPEARRALARYSLVFVLAVAVAHVANLCIPVSMARGLAAMDIAPLAVTTAVLAVPFFLSGVVVTLALTRVGSRIGLLYGFDLLGAAAGCLLVIPLLNHWDLSSAVFATAAIAAAGACCFARLAPAPRPWRAPALLFGVLLGGAFLNAGSERPLGILYAKDKYLHASRVQFSRWNTHSYVMAWFPGAGAPIYWGAGKGSDAFRVEMTGLTIDADAGAVMTRWDGRRESLAWALYDVTSLPYHLRSGDAAVIGVGGGRDVLSALAGGSTSVTGIEVNGILLDLLRGSHRDYTRIADRSDVMLVHDEARSYLSRTDERFDVIQMSLTDTWAATGAGAFALSENGLYTLDAWSVFLDRLKPGGLFSVSRWFSPDHVSETSRLLALAVATLLRRGAESPSEHIALVTSGSVATLLVSGAPMAAGDVARILEVAGRLGFQPRLLPGHGSPFEALERIANSRSFGELESAIADPHYDYSPPTDDHPYFFNILRPGSFYRIARLEGFGVGGVVFGNIRATTTLVVLFGIAAFLVTAIILGPLLRSGRPDMGGAAFGWSLLCFASVGLGFMLMQVPFLQRFSVYLGHPTYALSVILFSMILFAGLGSLVSDRLRIDDRDWHVALPIGVALLLLLLVLAVQPVFDATIGLGLPARCLIAVGLTAPPSFLAGFCFPLAMRIVGRVSGDASAWMWGVNGAFGVVGSILAVATSLWLGIQTSLTLAAAAYAAFAGFAWRLERVTR